MLYYSGDERWEALEFRPTYCRCGVKASSAKVVWALGGGERGSCPSLTALSAVAKVNRVRTGYRRVLSEQKIYETDAPQRWSEEKRSAAIPPAAAMPTSVCSVAPTRVPEKSRVLSRTVKLSRPCA